MVTLNDVAKRAQVSIATVSAVVNNKTERYRITAETIDRVQKIIDELHYRPSPNARALHRGKSETVGVLFFRIKEVANEIYGNWIASLSKNFHGMNINTMLLVSDLDATQSPKMIREKHIDGVVLFEYVPESVLREINNLRIPYVVVNANPQKPTDCVLTNDHEGMCKAVRYLIELGHRDITYMGLNCKLDFERNYIDHPSAQIRNNAYLETMIKAGLTIPPHVTNAPFCYDECEAWLYECLDKPAEQRPTALVSYSDVGACKTLKVAAKLGIKVPEELSIIAFNNTMITESAIPALTTVDVNFNEMGKAAAKMLYKKVYQNEKALETIIVEENLMVRESTAPPPRR